jgi:hypothetical protein
MVLEGEDVREPIIRSHEKKARNIFNFDLKKAAQDLKEFLRLKVKEERER